MSAGAARPVHVAVAADGVATVTVDHPPVNAMDDATLGGLGEAAACLGADPDVRAIVVAGTGTKAFLAGADLRELRDHLGVPGGLDAHVAVTRPVFDAWRRLPQPVVAAVQANAVGGGLEFALICDLIVADPRARLGLPEVTLGLIPGGGGTQRLPRRVGLAAATELLLLGRLVTAERAHALGLVNVVAAEGGAPAEARQIAARLAALPAVALRAAKRALRHAAEDTLVAGLDAELELFVLTAASSDAREGATAFLEKRAPGFTHR